MNPEEAKTWLRKQGSCSMDPTELGSLLEYHQRAEWEALKLYGHNKNVMLVLVTAVFAGSAALLSSSTAAFLWLSLLVPAAVSTTCFFAMKSLDRYYQRFLEAVVCSAKVEYMLGRHCPAWPQKVPPGLSEMVEKGVYPFRDDPKLDVDRHWRSRLKSENVSSSTWIEQHMSRGHNGVVGRFLGALFVFSLLIPLSALLRVAALNPASSPCQLWEALLDNGSFLACVVLSVLLSLCLYCYQCYRITKGRRSDQAPISDQAPKG